MSEPLYPEVEVELIGQDGNAFFILGAVSTALRKAGHIEAAKDFATEAMSGNYDHLLRTAMKFVEVF